MAPYLSKYQKVCLVVALLCAIDKKKHRKKRKWMSRSLKERNTLSQLNILNLHDFDDLDNFLGMDKETFDELLDMVRPLITKKDTVMRRAVTAEERLVATIKYLATGAYYKDLRNSTTISQQLLSKIIPETCWAIYKVLRKTFKMPSTEDEWKTEAKLFEEQWQFNNCVGCMDGKHILIEKPPGSGSSFYNYKGTFSVVLFAIVNANYEFIYVHTDSNGSISDGDIIKHGFYEKLIDEDLGLPEFYSLPGTSLSVPYVFLGDSAFALDTQIMTPFPENNISREKRIFNYRLHRARRVVDNAFGILASRFRVFRRPITLNLDNVDAIVMASCALHNFLRRKSKTYLTPTSIDYEDVGNHIFRPGEWRQNDTLTPLQRTVHGHYNDGEHTRNILTQYFNVAGRVSFQDKMADIVPE